MPELAPLILAFHRSPTQAPRPQVMAVLEIGQALQEAPLLRPEAGQRLPQQRPSDSSSQAWFYEE